MDKENARKFVEELTKLQEKYGITISSNYEEEVDYNYEEEPYVCGVNSFLTLVDKEGFEIALDDLLNGYFTCSYCGRNIEGDSNFCNKGCEAKFNANRNK